MRRLKKSWPVLILLSPALIKPSPFNRCTNKLALNVPNNILRNSPICAFASFLIFLLTLLLLNQILQGAELFLLYHSFPHLKLLMSLCQIQTLAFINDATAVNTKGIKTLLANGLSTFLIKGNPVFSNDRKSLSKNARDCSILCNLFFDNFI